MIGKIFNKIIIIIMFLISIPFSFLQSLPNGSVDKVQNETMNEFEYANAIGNEILDSIKNRDLEKLNNIYCNKLKNSIYLNDEIEFVFNYIDENGGMTIEDGEWQVPYSHGSNNGIERTVKYISCEYTGNIEIGNKKYELCFEAYPILTKHLDYQGVLKISIYEYRSIEELFKRDKNKDRKKKFLGFELFSKNKETYVYESILPKELYENDFYILPDNLEDDR